MLLVQLKPYIIWFLQEEEEKEDAVALPEHLNVSIHIFRKIVQINSGRVEQIKSHHRNREIYDNVVITEIARKIGK
jgi:hypothetical protein